MLILGVDIAARKGGSNCGLGLITPIRELVSVRSIDGTSLSEIASAISYARGQAVGRIHRPDPAGVVADDGLLIAIERQFAARVGPDPSAVEKLVGARTRFETVAEIRGVPYVLVYPSVWQATMFALLLELGLEIPTKIHKPRKPKVKKVVKGKAPPPVLPAQPELPEVPAKQKLVRDTKAASRLLCAHLFPGVELTGDECDALGLALHVARDRGLR